MIAYQFHLEYHIHTSKLIHVFPQNPNSHLLVKAAIGASVTVTSGVGVTKTLFVNFSVSILFDLTKVPVRLFASHSYLTGVTAAELRQHLPNINVIFNS